MSSLIAFSQAHSTELFAALWSISELLACIPQVRANGIFHLVQLLLQAKQEKP